MEEFINDVMSFDGFKKNDAFCAGPCPNCEENFMHVDVAEVIGENSELVTLCFACGHRTLRVQEPMA
jgi:Zn ribbon nucleic-acid-binding protein